MATIGLDKLFYAPITEEENGDETYGSPVMLAKAMTAELSIELNEAILYADDGPSEIVKEFKNGALSLGVDDIGVAAARALTGAQVDDNGVLISASENDGSPVAVGFRDMGIPAAVWASVVPTYHLANEYSLISRTIGDAQVLARMLFD